ncbi:MAG: metal-dependent hydrolase [Crocinitomicaceae bacterium]
MDSLTQIVLGASVAEACGGKKLGNKAALWGAIAGTIPDLDVFIRAYNDPIHGALMHRGFSHSILFAILVGPLLGYLIYRIYRRKHELKTWMWVAFMAIVTHPMLDIFTSYGTQFFWPFEWRVTFNSVFVIDPLYTLPFGFLLLASLIIKRNISLRRKLNNAGLIYSGLYLLWCVAVKLTILNNTPTYFKDYKIDQSKTVVNAMPFTSFYWMIITESNTSNYIGYKSIFYPFNKNEIDTLTKNHSLLAEIENKNKAWVQTLQFMTKNCYTVVKRDDSLEVYDLKFGLASQFTNPKIASPVRGYGLVIDNGIVNKTYITRPNDIWSKVNFGRYINKIFDDDKSPAPTFNPARF